jgi:hypothetical protein
VAFTPDESFDMPCEADTAARVKRQKLGAGLRQNVVLLRQRPDSPAGNCCHQSRGRTLPSLRQLYFRSADHHKYRVSVRSVERLFSSHLPASCRGAVANLHERILAAIHHRHKRDCRHCSTLAKRFLAQAMQSIRCRGSRKLSQVQEGSAQGGAAAVLGQDCAFSGRSISTSISN